MKNLIEELLHFTNRENFTLNKDNLFLVWHYGNPQVFKNADTTVKIENSLKSFLTSTLDVVRMYHAFNFSKPILRITDIDDADYFRIGLMRRELSGNMAYSKQRDHSAHTLYNYLIGWYIYTKSKLFQEKFKEHVHARINKYDGSNRVFGTLWPLTSILHDIGYIFEGSINTYDTSLHNELIKIGAEIVNEYFHHGFWIACKMDSVYDRANLFKVTNVNEPCFKNLSITGIADSLRSLGDLQTLKEKLGSEIQDENLSIVKRKILENRLPEDAFDLWHTNYKYFDNESMQDRIKTLRLFFEFQMSQGFNGTGIRILDHGVCSGLLLLLYCSYYFRIYAALDNTELSGSDLEIAEQFKGRAEEIDIKYNYSWWWESIIWATAATAIHNFMQLNHEGPITYKAPAPLNIEEDPLAYLGILVDCLQEWDRYSVDSESIFSGVLPLQGVDIKMGVNTNDKIEFRFTEMKENNVRSKHDYKDKIEKSLTKSLHNWQDYIQLSYS